MVHLNVSCNNNIFNIALFEVGFSFYFVVWGTIETTLHCISLGTPKNFRDNIQTQRFETDEVLCIYTTEVQLLRTLGTLL